jgi:hypothetical protein
MELRARPIDFCMSDSMPFCQRWVCKTTWPLADILNDEFFLTMRQSLKAGDTIRLSRFDRNDANSPEAKLLETCEVIVAASGQTALKVPVAVIGVVIILGDGPSMASYEVRRGQAGKFKLMQGEEVLQEFGSKAECEAALKQKLAA